MRHVPIHVGDRGRHRTTPLDRLILIRLRAKPSRVRQGRHGRANARNLFPSPSPFPFFRRASQLLLLLARPLSGLLVSGLWSLVWSAPYTHIPYLHPYLTLPVLYYGRLVPTGLHCTGLDWTVPAGRRSTTSHLPHPSVHTTTPKARKRSRLKAQRPPPSYTS
jgi:hypothetical protein